MQQDAERIAGLISGYLKSELDEAKLKELELWINHSPGNRLLFDKLTNASSLPAALDQFHAVDSEAVWKKMLQRIQIQPHTIPAKVRVMHSNRWAYIAAASIIIMISTGAYLWFRSSSSQKANAVPGIASRFKNDVAPGGDKAVLTLSDGSAIVLENTQNGTTFRQGGTKVNKEAFQLVYTTPVGVAAKEGMPLAYNTVSTPRGGQFRVVLPDGSKVWLNAASSLSFPVVFTGHERNVELSGEAYFEVAPVKLKEGNGKLPFRVSVNGMKVEVLGTRFNVTAYGNEEVVKTTLLEGAVNVVAIPTPHSTLTVHDAALKPGQQSQLDKNGIKIINDPDVNAAVAWKDGRFHFKDADIGSIMRQMERWYDAEVVYENNIDMSDHFVADIPRNVPASKLLELLELTNKVHFKIEGRKITVTL
jgi:transmembrane sensor